MAVNTLSAPRPPRVRGGCAARRFPAAVLIPCALVGLAAAAGCRKAAPPPPAPPDVLVAAVVQQDVPILREWVGTLDGSTNAGIRPQVSGYVLRQAYDEGTWIRQGALLFEIDPRPFQAVLDEARGQRAQAQAQFGKTELNVKRYTPLAEQKAVSQEELDDAIQDNLAAKAAVAAAQAAVERAELNLGFTRLIAPVDGIAGISDVAIGDLVGPSGSALTMVSAVDPIKVYFPISEQEYMKAAEHARAVGGAAEDVLKDGLELVLADGSVHPHKGRVSVADRQVDVRTGTIRIAGLFPNPGNVLRPGQFARVRAAVGIEKGARLVPQRAVSELQGSYHVAVVGADHKIQFRPVQVGERTGGQWVIREGVQPGEQVVVEGLLKIRDGLPVNPKPYAPPAGAGP